MSPESVPLGSGLPSREELLEHYPPKFPWEALRAFVNSGDLGLLKRDRSLQKRYNTWAVGVRKEYGSLVNYLLQYRLQWGKPDTLSKLPSSLAGSATSYIPAPGPECLEYFSVNTPAHLIFIMANDWPYSVPPEIEHSLIWSKVPVIDMKRAHPSVVARLEQDGIWGFTGAEPPDPSMAERYLPLLADWNVTPDKMVRSDPPTEEEAEHIGAVKKDVQDFIKRWWKEEEWETAWFVNPPRLQSVPGLDHTHVFARRKS